MKKTLSLATVLLFGMLCSKALQADCSCTPNIVEIQAVPFHIDGTVNPSDTTYCVTNNLTYLGGTGMPTAAITVDPGVHDIVINFNGFELDLAPSVNGISMLGTAADPIVDVIIKDGVIKSTTPSGANNGVFATNFNTVAVEHMRFVDTRRGFLAPSQTDTNINATFRSCVFDLKGITGVGRRGIALSTIQGLSVEDCSFLANDPNEAAGVAILLVNNAKNASIKRCTFDGQLTTGITVQSLFDPDLGFFFTFPSTNIEVNECEFTDSGVPSASDARFIGTSNVHVTNCSFYGTGNQLGALGFQPFQNASNQINSPAPSGFLVDNCTFTSTSQGDSDFVFNYATLFAGSIHVPGINTRDVIIQNSTFTHQGAPPRGDDLLLVGIEGVLIENCIFDSSATGRLSGCEHTETLGIVAKSANIHLGGVLYSGDFTQITGSSNVRDVTIRGNEICGGSQVGIYAETGTDTSPNERITIQDNSITAIEEGILFENTHSSTIIGNRVQGIEGNSCKKGVGIELKGKLSYNRRAASTSNAIVNNIVSNNDKGIELKCGAQGNLVQGNKVFNNSTHQIKEQKKNTNIIIDNIRFKYSNQKLDCSSSSSSSSTDSSSSSSTSSSSMSNCFGGY